MTLRRSTVEVLYLIGILQGLSTLVTLVRRIALSIVSLIRLIAFGIFCKVNRYESCVFLKANHL